MYLLFAVRLNCINTEKVIMSKKNNVLSELYRGEGGFGTQWVQSTSINYILGLEAEAAQSSVKLPEKFGRVPLY